MTAHSPDSAGRPGGGDKRERILDAAEAIFARSGFFHARVAEIARQAGVADGTIYLYFKSKDDLLISLFESRMERVNRDLAEAIAPAATAIERLLLFVNAYLRLIAENPVVAEVLTIELRQSSKFMKEYANPRFAELLKMLGNTVAEGQQSGELEPSVPAPVAARMIFGILDELALAWLLGRGEKFDIVRAVDWVGAFILRGLAARRDS
jgi:TetR/AcrR family transcriptional regulator, fatty acid metabolism regulator protein